MNLSNLKEYSKNPRKITEDRFKRLQDSLAKFGDLGGIVVNRPTEEIIGGNQRTKTFLQERERYAIKLINEFEDPTEDGTVAYGYVIRDQGLPSEQRFSYREVVWTEEQCADANILANKISGQWDFDVLANSFDSDHLLDLGFSKVELGLSAGGSDVLDGEPDSGGSKESKNECPNCGHKW